MVYYIQMCQPLELCDMDGHLLLSYPTSAETHAEAANCVIPIGKNMVDWVPIGELLVINVGNWSWKTYTIHTPHFNTRRVEITSEVLGVLPHIPGARKRIEEFVE